MERRDKHSHERTREESKIQEYGKNIKNEDEKPEVEKEKPSLALSGNLAKDTNLINGVVVKYNEPPEARKPRRRWRLYCFKGETELPFYQIHRQSAYLFGRDRLVADIPVDHPSCSKQHAAFQYRMIEYKRKDGRTGRTVKPYIIDLGSTNGTFINNKQIEAQRYFELREKDVIKFGFSSREYILLHEESKNDLEDLDAESFDESDKEEKTEEAEPVQVKKEKENSESDKEEIDLKKFKSKNKHKKKSRSSSSESASSQSDDDRERKRKKRR
ncbi:smad nuclear-interacting 1 [Brachionus plicatilis]|uniref:Smad nuclear-interacting 1 n=1 Tax=Brachionus plicatilis TaxID=10195 RepID=A0A3M7SH74_BRAPC|nr:smad nuclear-interacting 1 [Brachionus plicatilis]